MSESERERHAELADLQSRRDRFVAIADMLDKELHRGAISLCEATERLFFYCVQNYPEHLDNVALAEMGRNIKTRLARNLLRAFEGDQGPGITAAVDEAAVRLEREMRELRFEEESAGRIEER
jgi:hypothetical protein